MNDTDTETLWLGAFRYYLGRRTYAVGEFCALLIWQWGTLPSKCQKLIERELEAAVVLDDTARRNDRPCWPLGHECDRAEWDKVRKLWGQP